MDASRLTQTAEKLRTMIEQSQIQVDQKIFDLTVSIGATLVRADDTYESLLERADRLLYKSKSDGRNRVSFQE
jgi:diguanylate cyclase (GGDEF)-like protein